MMKMRYIDQWLSGLGLEHIIPKLTEHGITTPKKLAQLNLRDMYELVGIEDAEDRKKLFYLIQRLNTIFKKEQSAEDADSADPAGDPAPPEPEEPPPSGPAPPAQHAVLTRASSEMQVSPLRARPEPSAERALGASVSSVDSAGSDDDLQALRRQRRGDGPPDTSRAAGRARAPEHVEPPSLRAPSPILPPSDLGAAGDILGRAEQASTGRMSTSYQPSTYRSVSQGSADVGIGSVTAKVLARRQQREQAMQDGAAPRHSHGHSRHHEGHHEPPPRRQSSQEVDLDSRLSGARTGAESPPPPAPPLSNSGGGSGEGLHAFQREPKAQAAAPSDRRYGQQQYGAGASFGEDVYDDEEEGDYRPGPSTAEVLDMAIRVVVRKRPISRSELAKDDNDVVDIEAGSVFVHEPKTKVDLTKVIETHVFQFDDAFGHEVTNEEIYSRTVKHLMGVLFDLGKASCFAYGQTGSGKTFTMMGSDPASPATVRVNAGLYVLAARDIFERLRYPEYRDLIVFVSCFEIYSGKLFDLLNDRNVIKCLEDSKQQVQLPGLTEHQVGDVDSLLQLMAQAHSLRSIGSTGANLESSRSHQVLQIVLRKPEPVQQAGKARRMGGVVTVKAPKKAEYGKLSFIDLAGSERGVDTSNNSKQTRLEGAEINTSLLALKEVIRSLERKHGHTPFRGSKLTQVLKDSFVGEKTRTCMVACISPSHTNCEHTLNTLRYADRVKEHQASSNPGGGAEGGPEGRVSPPQQLYSGHDGGAPPRPQRPSTAAPPAEIPRSSSTGQARPSTAAGGNQPSSWELDRIRREAEGRRRPGSAYPEAPPEGMRRPVSAISTSTTEGFNRRESKIPSSPSARNRQKIADFGGNRATSPNTNSPARNSIKPSPARAPANRQRTYDSRDTWQPKTGGAESNAGGPAPNPFASLQAQASPDRGSARLPEIRKEPPARRPSNEGFSRASPPTRLPSPSPEKIQLADDIYDDNGEDLDLTDSPRVDESELLHKTVDLLSAHKLAIAEMVEVMKDEMGLVQDMEASDERDSERYAEVLHNILMVKSESINILQQQLRSFQEFRKNQ